MSAAGEVLGAVLAVVSGLELGYAQTILPYEPPVFTLAGAAEQELTIYATVAGAPVTPIGRRHQQIRVGISLYPVAVRTQSTESVARYQSALEAIQQAFLPFRHTALTGTVFRLIAPGRQGVDAYRIINEINQQQAEVGADVLATRINLLFRALQS